MTWLAARGRYDKDLRKIMLTAVIVTDGAAEASAMTAIDAARPGVSHEMLALRLGCELAKANCHDKVAIWPEQSAAAKSVYTSVGPAGEDYFDTDVTIVPGHPDPDELRYLDTVMDRIDEIMADERPKPDDREDKIKILASRVLSLHRDTPDGHGIQDADTVLADIMSDADFELTGIGPEVIQTWQASWDKRSVEKLFQSLTGHEFTEYLRLCEEQTTRK